MNRGETPRRGPAYFAATLLRGGDWETPRWGILWKNSSRCSTPHCPPGRGIPLAPLKSSAYAATLASKGRSQRPAPLPGWALGAPHCRKKAARTGMAKENPLFPRYRADGLTPPYAGLTPPRFPQKTDAPPLRRASVFDIASPGFRRAVPRPGGLLHPTRGSGSPGKPDKGTISER